jgi:hypothetical protein
MGAQHSLELAREGRFAPRELLAIERPILQYLPRVEAAWLNTAGHEYPKIVTVEVTDRWITASFSDGQ